MDKTLVEDAEDDIDGQDRAGDQQALVRKRILKSFAVPEKVVEIVAGMPIFSFSASMRLTLSPSATPCGRL